MTTEVRKIKVIRPPKFSVGALFSDLALLKQYFDLLVTLSQHRIRVRYKQSALGLAWAILQPLMLMLIYTVIFSNVAKVKSEGLPYAVFVYSALLPWTFFQSSLTNAATSLVTHTQLITKVYFPREILPITYVIAALFDFAFASLVLIMLMVYYHVGVTLNVLYAIPIMMITAVLTSSLAMIFSAAQVRFRDIGLAMPLILQLWTFASPVVYSLNEVPVRFRAWYVLNPMVGLVENFRRVVVQGLAPDFQLLMISAVISAILLGASYMFFKRLEATMADII